MTDLSIKSILCIALIFCCAPMAVADVPQRILVIGLLGEQLPGSIDQQDAKALKVTEMLADVGIEKTEFYAAENVEAMIDALKEGKVDWLTAPLFQALIYAENANAVIFPQKLKTGISKFHTVFFVKKTSDITQLEKMERKMVGFADPLSTSDFFVPYYELHEHNYTLVKYGEKVDDEVLGKKRLFYRLSGSQRDVVKDVLSSQVDIGVLSNHQYEKILPELKSELKIIYKTASFPVEVEVMRSDIDVPIKKKLREVINQYNSENDDTSLLMSDGKEGKFYDFVGEGRDGFVYLKSIIKHGVVPVILSNKEVPDKKKK